MTRRFAILSVGFALLVARADAVDPFARTISSSRQFIIYSADAELRSRVASSLEEVKADTLRLLGEPDRPKMPIV